MSEEKRAAFVVSEYNEKVFYGGGEKVNSYIIDELLNRGYTVDVFADVIHVENSEKVNIYQKEEDFDKNFDDIMKKYSLVLSTNLEYPSEITYSHSHSFFWKKNIFTLFFRQIFSKTTREKYKKYKIALANSLKIPKVVISSNIIKEDYLKNYNIPSSNLFILPPGVDYEKKEIVPPRKDYYTFGLVGKSFTKKGAFLTLFAVFLLKKLCKNFKVRIINRDYYKKKRHAILINIVVQILGVGKYVEFLPLQDNMQNFYKSVDCVLVPSLKEPFGLVVTEAMIYSKPVISGSLCGAADLIVDNENGMIADFSKLFKIKPLADKMYQMMNLPEEKYVSMAQKAYDTVKDMSYTKFAKEFVDLAEK